MARSLEVQTWTLVCKLSTLVSFISYRQDEQGHTSTESKSLRSRSSTVQGRLSLLYEGVFMTHVCYEDPDNDLSTYKHRYSSQTVDESSDYGSQSFTIEGESREYYGS